MSDETSILEYQIPAVRLALSDSAVGRLQPYTYQSESLSQLKEHEDCLLEVYAGTGMGKTAVAVMAALNTGTKTAMFVYPTNELIENQVKSITKTCELVGEPEPIIETIHSSELLEFMVEKELSSRATALKVKLWPRTDGEAKFVLTNPDTLHLILRLRYGRKRRYGKQAAEIISTFMSYSTLVIDEFHVYEGRELASLYFDIAFARYLKVFRHILLMTATPHQGLSDHLGRLAQIGGMEHPKPVMARPVDKGRTVVHDVHLKVMYGGENELEQMRNYLVSIKDELKQLRTDNPSDDFIPACAILNSVIAARTLSEMLLEEFENHEIKESHGLIPQKMRRDRGNALVLVGTSAIEVGIDFDTSHLLFEAMDAPSAIQRLGRVGRHRTGKAIFFTPKYVYNYFSTYVQDVASREALNDSLRDAFGERDPGLWYINSAISREETTMLSSEIARAVEATPAAGSYASATSVEEFFDALFENISTAPETEEWLQIIRDMDHAFVTLRASEPQALVIDYTAQRRGFFPVYFSPISRVLRRAMKFKFRGIDPETALKPLYAMKKKFASEQARQTIEGMIRDYRIHYKAGRRFCVVDVFDYMRDKGRFVKMSYAEPMPQRSQFEPIVGINKDDGFMGAPLGLISNVEGVSEIDSLFVNRFYAIVDQSTHNKLPWGLERYPIIEGNRIKGWVYFDGSALVALARYLDMKQRGNSL